MKILIINGPNLNLLGVREPEIYGSRTYTDLVLFIKEKCRGMGAECEIFQSNHEGAIIDKIQEAAGKFDGIVINPAGYTHTSVAIADAIRAVGVPTVEVHLSNIDEREDFRKISYTSAAVQKTVMGKSFEGYAEAIDYLMKYN